MLEQSESSDVTTFDLSALPLLSKTSCIQGISKHIASERYDLLITYRCPYILPAGLFLKFPLGGYNIHPSLLPDYSGLNPWIEIFKNKDRTGGVTLHRLEEQVDQGEILRQAKFELSQTDTIASAREKADRVACDLLLELLSSF